MAKADPFGFDMSVSTAKKRRTRGKRGMSGAFETSTRGCEHTGCEEAGQYRAPKSPDILDDFFWFCKDHVREYNLKWNFFHGNTEEELAVRAAAILDEERNDTVLRGHTGGNERDDAIRNAFASEAGNGQIKLLRERANQMAFLDHSHFDQRDAEPTPPSTLFAEC